MRTPLQPRMNRSRSRSRSSSSTSLISPSTSLNRGSASPTRHSWYASVYPTPIQNAQTEPICKVAIEDEVDLPIGYIYAEPMPPVQEVASIANDLHIDLAVRPSPEGVRVWRDVERVSGCCPARRVNEWTEWSQLGLLVTLGVQDWFVVKSRCATCQTSHSGS